MILFNKTRLVLLYLVIVCYSFFEGTVFASPNYNIAIMNRTKKEMKVVYQPHAILNCVYVEGEKTLVLPRPKSIEWKDEVVGFITPIFKNNFLCNPKKSSARFKVSAKNDDGSFIDLATLIIRSKVVGTMDDNNIVKPKWEPYIEVKHSAVYNPKEISIQEFELNSVVHNQDATVTLCDAHTKGDCY